MVEFLGIIPARARSVRLPNKHMLDLNGKPMIGYTFDAVKQSKLLNRCIVSTNDLGVIEYAEKKGMDVPFMRPDYLCTNDASSLDVILHSLNFLKGFKNYEPDYVVLLQPTSPLRIWRDIDNSIQLIIEDSKADSLVSVMKAPHSVVPENIMILKNEYLKFYIDKSKILSNHEVKEYYIRNGAAIYITSYDMLMNKKRIIGDNCIPYEMPKERSIDIDDLHDFRIAEMLLKNGN